jgi:hypothetical protein
MNAETETETMSLDEVNRALDLTRERDPSIEPEPGYSCAARTQESGATVEHATNLSILAASALIRGQTPTEAIDIAVELYNQIQECAGRCASGGEGELLSARDPKRPARFR